MAINDKIEEQTISSSSLDPSTGLPFVNPNRDMFDVSEVAIPEFPKVETPQADQADDPVFPGKFSGSYRSKA